MTTTTTTTAVAHGLAADTPVTSRTASTRRDDLLVAAAGTWLLLGLFVDGWAHTNLTELETFFTPWHALFYTGFLATAVAVGRVVQRDRTVGIARSATTPRGYRPALVGLVAFAVGGIGDGIWHTVFGIETSLDALLSPTHLFMFVGILLLVTTPVRAGLARLDGRVASRHQLLPVLVGTLLATLLVSFFFMYAWAPTGGLLGVAYVPGGDELVVAFGVLQVVVTTVLLLAPIAMLWTRVDLPVGWATLLLGIVGLLMSALQAFDDVLAVVPPLLAGMVLDVAARRGWLSMDAPTSTRVVFGAAGLVLAAAQVAVFALTRTVAWPPELWGGAIVFSAFTGIGLTLLTLPPGAPDTVHPDTGRVPGPPPSSRRSSTSSGPSMGATRAED